MDAIACTLSAERRVGMLIICSEEEKKKIIQQCNGVCCDCVFKHVKCPVEENMIITENQVANGKDLEVKGFL